MKFKWYHAILILVLVILIAGMSFFTFRVYKEGSNSGSNKAKTKSSEVVQNKKTEKPDEDDKAENKTDQTPESDTEDSSTIKRFDESTSTTEDTSLEKKRTGLNSVVKALVVDNQTKSSKRMVKYLKKAGFRVDLVGSLDDFRVEDYDTLVIPGGHNITPSIYGAERDEHTYGTDIDIDKLQIKAIKKFAQEEKPVLGVCRGCQVVNVAFGGTINQHIPGWHKKYRRVKIDKSSWLYPRLGTSESVYHYHHQCVEELGKGLIATQWDEEDEHIEAIEHETLPVYGIQWHPDSMGNQGVDVFRYYKELVLDYKNKVESEDQTPAIDYKNKVESVDDSEQLDNK